MKEAKVSVIVPCYNQGLYLDECLSSVLTQTFKNWECIIVNDGSFDNTHEISQVWVEKDERFKYIKIKNGGLSNARNSGISVAEGTYILPLDADDKIGVDYIDLAISSFTSNQDLSVVYCFAEKFGDEIGRWMLPTFSLSNLAISNIIFCSAIYKKSDWEILGGYDVNMKKGFEDWEFWISLLKHGGQVCCLSYTGFYYRIRHDSMVRSLNENNISELTQYLSVKHADFFVSQLGSFQELNLDIKRLEYLYKKNRLFKKQILNNFCKAFLGFSFTK